MAALAVLIAVFLVGMDAAGEGPSGVFELGPGALVVPRDYATVEQAMTAAHPGDDVYLEPGVYEESVRFTSGVRLVGAGADKVVVRAEPAQGHVLRVEQCHYAAAAGITFEMAHQPKGRVYPRAVLRVDDSVLTLEHCIVQNGSGAGLHITRSGLCRLAHCVVQDNGGHGVLAEAGTRMLLAEHCAFRGNGGHGVAVDAGSRAILEENACLNNAMCGIAVANKGSHGRLEGNLCSGNGASGVYFGYRARGAAVDNACSLNSRHGIHVDGGAQEQFLLFDLPMRMVRADVGDNVCSENEGHGILYDFRAEGRIEDNLCARNALSGIAVAGWPERFRRRPAPTLHANECYDNRQHGILFARYARGAAEHNRCTGNALSGIAVLGNDAAPRIRFNECAHNGAYGILASARANPTIEANLRAKGNSNGLLGYAR